MHGKKEGRKCCHNNPRSSVVFHYFLLRDYAGVYIPFCWYNHQRLKEHQGIVVERQDRACRRKGCWHYIKYRPEKTCRQLLRFIRARPAGGRPNEPKIAAMKPLEDSISQFIPYCANPDYNGIIQESYYRKCEHSGCEMYKKFRSPVSRWKKCRKPIILKSLAELNGAMFGD